MKVKVTTTLTLETDLTLEDYADFEDGPKTEDEMIPWEVSYARDNPDESDLVAILLSDGEISNFKIEKMEDAAAAEEAA
jgi:hypothetical protein